MLKPDKYFVFGFGILKNKIKYNQILNLSSMTINFYVDAVLK